VAVSSTIVVFAGILLGWFLYSRPETRAAAVASSFKSVHTAMREKFYFDHFYDKVLISSIYNNFARVLNFIEVNIIINFLVNGFAYISRQIGKALRMTITGQLQHYTLYMVGGVVILVIVFLQYYG
jgi:NADH-quinone oxidoreductase subunit L